MRGQVLAWRRDPVDMNAFHLEIPSGVTVLEADLEMLTAPAPDGVVQGLETPRTATESLLILEWNQLLLYPAGARSDDLTYEASVHLPAGLEVRHGAANHRRYRRWGQVCAGLFDNPDRFDPARGPLLSRHSPRRAARR